ncbi:MAG: lysophospholipase [Hylemonella sp.]|uniref:alpha/beta hydrolase n=1 Tax=Hylemonella sp. TaxID=2066020 RepID=UPI0022BBB7D8|nr:alpha/beta hydrolase [Hylemonella sp.]MCZ8252878.1 lysophospholipase [Hylemonella sp.]
MQESTLTTYVASDGDNLAIQDWPLDPGTRLRGVVLIVHGLGEHAGRYDELARRLNDWGFAVRGYDHYGHGESGGLRGGLPSEQRLVEDLADVLGSTRRRLDAGTPLIVLGHSMGGLVAAHLVARQLGRVDGLVLSSPALDPGLNAVQKCLLAVLPAVAPDLRVGNGLDPKWISHDPQVVRAYQQDKLIHDRISGRLARYIADTGPQVLAAAPRWDVPTLLMYAGQDKLVSPRGSAAFAKAAPARVLEAHCYAELYHEIFNELEREPVYARLQAWLDRWFA